MFRSWFDLMRNIKNQKDATSGLHIFEDMGLVDAVLTDKLLGYKLDMGSSRASKNVGSFQAFLNLHKIKSLADFFPSVLSFLPAMLVELPLRALAKPIVLAYNSCKEDIPNGFVLPFIFLLYYLIAKPLIFIANVVSFARNCLSGVANFFFSFNKEKALNGFKTFVRSAIGLFVSGLVGGACYAISLIPGAQIFSPYLTWFMTFSQNYIIGSFATAALLALSSKVTSSVLTKEVLAHPKITNKIPCINYRENKPVKSNQEVVVNAQEVRGFSNSISENRNSFFSGGVSPAGGESLLRATSTSSFNGGASPIGASIGLGGSLIGSFIAPVFDQTIQEEFELNSSSPLSRTP